MIEAMETIERRKIRLPFILFESDRVVSKNATCYENKVAVLADQSGLVIVQNRF